MLACAASELELNMAEPIIAFNLLFGLTLLRNAAIILHTRCIAGIKANGERCLSYVQNSIGLVTALNPVLGYEKSAANAPPSPHRSQTWENPNTLFESALFESV
jgi:aspartate ammonia-lyase